MKKLIISILALLLANAASATYPSALGTAPKGSTAVGAPTSSAASSNRQPLDVANYDPATGNANLWRPDSAPYFASEPTTLLFDNFESLDTTDVWTTGGTAPTVSGGLLTFPTGTGATAQSNLQSKNAFGLPSTVFLRSGMLVSMLSTAETGSKAWFGLGFPAGSPSVALPLTNGVVFETDDTTGALVGVVYSNSVRGTPVTLTRPTDGALHRYAIFYRSSRVYFEIDGVSGAAASIAFPNPAISKLPATIGVVNGASTVGAQRTISCSLMSMSDTGRNNFKISDSLFPWRQLTVKAPSVAPVATDSAAVTVTSPNSPEVNDLYLTGQSAQTATVNNIIPAASGANATDVTGYQSGSVQVTSTGTAGTFIFEGSNDNTNFQAIPVYNQVILTGTPITAAVTASATQIIYTFPIQFRYIRLRIASTITGGSIQAFSTFKRAAFSNGVTTTANATAQPVNESQYSGTAAVTGGVAGLPGVGGNVAVAAARTANPVPVGGVDTSALTRVNLMDVLGANQSYGAGESVTTFSVGTGAAAVTDGTNGKTIFLQPKNADFYVGFSAISTTPTVQFEISYDNVLFAVIPMSRVDNTAASQQYNGAAAFTPVLASMWRGKTYGAPILRVHLTAGTTSSTVGQVRVVYSPEPPGTLVSPFAFTATNTTEAVGVANGQIFTGGVRTVQIPIKGSAIAQLEIDADTGTNTVALEGSQDLGTTWNALAMQPIAGGATVTSFASTGTAALPQTGTWQADVSGMTNVRAHCTAYTSGNPFGALKIITVPTSTIGHSRKATYTASVSGAVTATTNVLSITSGSAKTTIIKRIMVNGGTATTVTDGSLTLIRGTVAAPAGGTAVTGSTMQHNPADAAFSGAVLQGIASAITTTGLTSTSSAIAIPTPVETATLGVSNSITYDFTNGGSIEGFQIPVAATNSVLFSFTGTSGGANFALSVDFTEE